MTIRNSMTDGITDALGWRDVRSQVKPPWVEAKFKTFTPEFHRAKICTLTVEDLGFWILVMLKAHPQTKAGLYEIEL